MNRGFVSILRDEFAAYSQEHQLSSTEQALLAHLLREADWRTGAVIGFNLTRCSKELGLGDKSGRRTLAPYVQRLNDAGVVAYTPARSGTSPGRIDLTDYRRLVHVPDAGQRAPSARSARENRALEPDTSARKPRAAQPELALLPGGSRTEDLEPEDKNLEREGERDPIFGHDWSESDLDELLAPLTELCRRCNLPGVTRRLDLIAALRPYPATEIRNAVGLMCRRTRQGGIRSPFGLLTAKAREGAIEYFSGETTAPAPAPDETEPEGEFVDPREGLARARAAVGR